jgi:hypothetical protein
MSELLPRQRPTLSLSLKSKCDSVLHHRRCALHEACHAVAYVRGGVTVLGLEMLTPIEGRYGWSGGFYSRVLAGCTPDDLKRGAGLTGLFAGTASDEICGVKFDADFVPADILGVTEQARMAMPDADPTALMELLRSVWADAVRLIGSPAVFGQAHAVACQALRHTTLDADMIHEAIRTATPFSNAALLARRVDAVLAKQPCWEGAIKW